MGLFDMRKGAVLPVIVAAAAFSFLPAYSEDIEPETVEFFETSIRPLLAETCYECHGSKKQENELRLDSLAAINQGGLSGSPVNRDNLAASLMIEHVEYRSEIKMPPDMRLDDHEIDAIRRWVLMGTPWPGEEAPSEPGEAPVDIAETIRQARDTHWAFQPVTKPEIPSASPIDALILEALNTNGLKPAARADKRTLIRRLSYDLTGLPPTHEEVQAYKNDISPDAFEDLVDRLLASPHYGERWARHWLDVARYADTKGYVFQEDALYPYSYTYRDYVVRSFNEDLPFNQFIIEQIAADRLELGEDKRPLAALGFLTLGRRFLNVLNDITDDRIDVVTRGMMGLTVSCARCHDHKFDPIPSADYYSLFGVFRSSRVPSEYPLIEEPDVDDPEYQEFIRILGERKDKLEAYEVKIHRELLLETQQKTLQYFKGAYDGITMDDEVSFKKLAKERELRPQILTPWRTYLSEKIANPDALFTPLAWFHALPENSFTLMSHRVTTRILEAGTETPINRRIQNAFKNEPPASMDEVVQIYVNVFNEIDSAWKAQLATAAQIAVQQPEAELSLPDSLADPAAESIRQAIFASGSPSNIAAGDVFRISDTPEQGQVRTYRRAIARHEGSHEGRPDRAMGFVDADALYEPYIYLRGKQSNRGDTVPRQFLQVLSDGPPKPFENGSGRLELAQAIASDNNPLTARVFVNRVWMRLMGSPLVGTPSDFGLRSDGPTHPELLDYLAATFMEDGWSVKKLTKRILMSSTYQQSSMGNADFEDLDIENKFLWRQNRKRLNFEAMRDSLLFASGKLDPTIGGKPQSLSGKNPTMRRTIYGTVIRQNMAGFIKTFDFASPDLHSPRRAETVVPQQALYLMNSPFSLKQARALSESLECVEGSDTSVKIDQLYQRILQRKPDSIEKQNITRFLTETPFDKGPPQPDPSEWQYGYGYYNIETEQVESFTAFTKYKKKRWQTHDEYPSKELGHITINSSGGHPGLDVQHAAIHRWVAPRDGTIEIKGRLRHSNENGDGVLGYVVSSRSGLLGDYAAFNGFDDTAIENVAVSKGDTIDFVVSPDTNNGYDSYSWIPKVLMDQPEGTEGESVRLSWDSRADFAGPLPAAPDPLTPWEQVAQVLLMTNEFMYVD